MHNSLAGLVLRPSVPDPARLKWFGIQIGKQGHGSGGQAGTGVEVCVYRSAWEKGDSRAGARSRDQCYRS